MHRLPCGIIALLALALALALAGPAAAQQRVAFPNIEALIPGYASPVRGEDLVYHSPLPWVDHSLLVRSVNRALDIEWRTAPVPPQLAGDTAVFVFAVGIDVLDERDSTPRRFDLFVDGDSTLTVTSPVSDSLGTTWYRGGGGIRLEFRATLVDKYGDLMGYAFLHVPRARVTPGRALTLRVAGESADKRTWFMVFKEPLREQVILRNAPALLRSETGNRQIVRVDLVSLTDRAAFRLRGPIGTIDTVVPLGHTRFELPVPAVERDTAVRVAFTLGRRSVESTVTVTPVRPLVVHLIHHTHLDIGYTEYQDSVERIQWSHLERALEYGRASEGGPDGERFVWNPENLWAVDSYIDQHADTAALMDGIRRGWIVLDAMFANLLTGLASTEGLEHALDAKERIERLTGVPITSAMQSDIPGFTWGLVSVLARHGVRYLSLGPNRGDHIGNFTEALGDKPFWWVSRDRKDSVLTWVHGAGYSLFHTGLGYTVLRKPLDDETVFGYLDRMIEGGYPYDLTVLRYNIGSDNGPPDSTLVASVHAWNRRYASPHLVISSVKRAFGEFEARYGAGLPVMAGDLTGYWEDGAQSSAEQTALVRRTANALSQTERLADLLHVQLPADDLYRAWRFVLLWYEHTWGAWNSVGEPEAESVRRQWNRKKSFADSAALAARALRASVVARAQTRLAGPNDVDVWNTGDRPRSDVVVLDAAGTVTDAHGKPVPAQRLRDGRLAFRATDVPARGSKRYRAVPERAAVMTPRPPASTASAAPTTIESSRFRVTVDPMRGTIASLLDKTTGRELARGGADGGLDRYVYVPGRDPQTAVFAQPGTVRIGENGPLVKSLVWSAAAPGTEGIESEVILYEGLDRVEIVNRIHKTLVYDPEAVLYRFAFAADGPQDRISVPGGWYRPEAEQLPGACRNYFSDREWIEVRDSTGTPITLLTPDVPMLQLGEIATDAIVTGWKTHTASSATVFSYAMNNYWGTNYRAGQEGDVVLRYAIVPATGEDAQAPPLVGIRGAATK